MVVLGLPIRNMIRRGESDEVAKEMSGQKTRDVFDRHDVAKERDFTDATPKIEVGGKTDTQTDTSAFAHTCSPNEKSASVS